MSTIRYKKKKKKKRNPVLRAERPSQVLSVGTLEIFFFLSGGKNDSIKKHYNLPKIWHFLEENLENIFSVIFNNFQTKFSLTSAKKGLILYAFSKPKNPKMGNLGQSGP